MNSINSKHTQKENFAEVSKNLVNYLKIILLDQQSNYIEIQAC